MKAGLLVIAALVGVGYIATDMGLGIPEWLWAMGDLGFYLGVALIAAGAVAKVVQIGVRSAKD